MLRLSSRNSSQIFYIRRIARNQSDPFRILHISIQCYDLPASFQNKQNSGCIIPRRKTLFVKTIDTPACHITQIQNSTAASADIFSCQKHTAHDIKSFLCKFFFIWRRSAHDQRGSEFPLRYMYPFIIAICSLSLCGDEHLIQIRIIHRPKHRFMVF